MWKLDHQEGWASKNWCFQTVVLEKALESPLTARRSNQTILKEVLSWIFIGRTDAKAETPILWPPDVKTWLTGKELDAGKDRGQEEKGATEDEMVGWHHWLNEHEFEQAPGIMEGREAWCAAVHRVTKNWTKLTSWTTEEIPTSQH